MNRYLAFFVFVGFYTVLVSQVSKHYYFRRSVDDSTNSSENSTTKIEVNNLDEKEMAIMLANDIRIETISFENASVKDAVQDINARVKKELKNLNLEEYQFSVNVKSQSDNKINLGVRNVSLMLLLQIISQQSNLELDFVRNGAILHIPQPEW